MEIEHHELYGKITLPEKIDLTNVNAFKRNLQALYDRGHNSIELDCTNLTIIDSAGLGSLIMFQKKLKERGGELKLINVNHSYIKHLFDMIELNRIIRINSEGGFRQS